MNKQTKEELIEDENKRIRSQIKKLVAKWDTEMDLESSVNSKDNENKSSGEEEESSGE